MKKFISLLLSLSLAICLSACQNKNEDIVIVYTNDVHSAIDQNITYAGLVSYVNELKENNEYVTLVDAGDAYQGSTACALTKGVSSAEALQYVDYDIMTFGNHEFDYGMDQLINLMNISGKTYINSNIVYMGTKEDNFLNDIKKYEIISYGNKKVGFVSFDTPTTINDSVPISFMEDEEVVYNFCFGEDGSSFYANAQKVIDECKSKGADYVVAICHLGQGEESGMYSSDNLVANTNNIDVVIDAHSHLVMPSQYNKNKDGKEVLITSSGTELANIGQIVISANGFITTSLINNYTDRDETVEKNVNDIVNKYTESLNTPIFNNGVELKIYDENGIRMVRSREMPIGDLMADAIRYFAKSDIAMINAGALRENLALGEINYSNFISVLPFENYLACIEVTGAELIDYLEYCYSMVASTYVKDGLAYGENGSFMQISGMKLTVDTSIPTSITVDENDYLLSVGETRRVRDIQILNANGEYEPIDPNKTYSLGGLNYSLILGGSGSGIWFKDHNILLNTSMHGYEIFADYITNVLAYDLTNYQVVDNRITIE